MAESKGLLTFTNDCRQFFLKLEVLFIAPIANFMQAIYSNLFIFLILFKNESLTLRVFQFAK